MGMRKAAPDAGTWAFPGGKVELWEHPLDAVARELKEETGLVAEAAEPLPWINHFFGRDWHYVTLPFLLQAKGEPCLIEPDKCGEWAWFDVNLLPKPLFPTTTEMLTPGLAARLVAEPSRPIR